MENNDGMQMPADLQRLDFEDGAPDESSDLSDDDMEEYMGDDDLGTGDEAEEAQAPGPLTAGVGEAGEKPLASAPVSHSGRPKQYHLSPEWLQLAEAGQHLLRLPPVAGCGVNRHPSGSFWSCRYPGQPSRTASWNAGVSPLRCLTLCLRHVIKLFLETKPADADVWHAQLHDLSKFG